MKPACASAAFHHAFERGDLTQLEFLDLCARELGCDVVLDVRHFPRTDDDYLAQVKKMATDLGITIAAVADSDVFGSDERMARGLECARVLGSPLLAVALASETEHPWSWQIERINAATSLAKSANVTLAVRNAIGSFASSIHDCKRVSKEADSAWLRFGLEPRAFGAGDDPGALAAGTVLLWQSIDDATPATIDSTLALFPAFRGAIVADAPLGDAGFEKAASAIRTWRTALASQALNRT